MARILTVASLLLFVLAALVGAGAIDPDPAVLRWQVLVALAAACAVGRDLA